MLTICFVWIAWAKSGVPDAAKRVVSILAAMEQKEVQPDAQTYTSAIDAIAQSGQNPQQAEAMLGRMVEAGVHPNVISYSAVINGTYVSGYFPRLL